MLKRILFALLLVAACGLATQASAQIEDYDMSAEVSAAVEAINLAHQNLPGMDGVGVLSDEQLEAVQGILTEAESMSREARRLMPDADTEGEIAWVVAYARASAAMAKVADEYRQQLGY